MKRKTQPGHPWPPADGTTVPLTLNGRIIGSATFDKGSIKATITDKEAAKELRKAGGFDWGVSVGRDSHGGLSEADVVLSGKRRTQGLACPMCDATADVPIPDNEFAITCRTCGRETSIERLRKRGIDWWGQQQD